MNPNRIIATMLIVSLAVVAYKTNKLGEWPPKPSRFIGVATVFTILAVLSVVAPPLAAAFSVAVPIGVYFGLTSAIGNALAPTANLQNPVQGSATAGG